MISVIICSRTKSLDAALSQNIADTIGVEYEVILIDNSENQYNIFQAYNRGVQQSKYNTLCFMHDDISYHTPNWGNAVVGHFADDQIDAIGIAGTPYCTFMPGPWWGNGIIYRHILQINGDGSNAQLQSNGQTDVKRQAVILDGVWFCIRKSMFGQISFDDATFKGFHFYDADICMQIHQAGGNLWCINDVLISHHSMGNVNRDWIDSALIFHKKWEKHLPATCLKLSTAETGRLEYKTLNSFILACAANGYTNRQIYSIAIKYLLSFKKGYLFLKTPGYFVKFLYKYLFKKGAPFYA
ncbi:hypothetical protein HQ865_11940 [Mucilaginibacter mali]|uniref:Streptomycin biosynthesis protein StrF domain-containing protein n=1 Tax=Mucilaginibacter mali TaxID=2740462 RepID=A0A7D4UFI0_9SPHI|nr:glycosyltransferase [Mucilaginibacter mali]QKJ30436.1 hypothetical protein HQ865_11940 [Mucilaginibacter mali]